MCDFTWNFRTVYLILQSSILYKSPLCKLPNKANHKRKLTKKKQQNNNFAVVRIFWTVRIKVTNMRTQSRLLFQFFLLYFNKESNCLLNNKCPNRNRIPTIEQKKEQGRVEKVCRGTFNETICHTEYTILMQLFALNSLTILLLWENKNHTFGLCLSKKLKLALTMIAINNEFRFFQYEHRVQQFKYALHLQNLALTHSHTIGQTNRCH